MSNAAELTTWQHVCQLDDLIPDSGICALINGQQVAIFYVPSSNPSVYAIGNWDPAGKANVLSRGIVADLKGELTVASPLYKQHFSLTTGVCMEDASLSVPVYEVSVNNDKLMVRV